MIETLLALADISVVGCFAFKNGNQYGSRKGFGAGRWANMK